MKVGGRHYRSIERRDGVVRVLDQTRLPHEVVQVDLHTLADAAQAISALVVRGAPLIGVTAAYGVALGLAADPSDAGLNAALATLAATRPTARNLRWALEHIAAKVRPSLPLERAATALVVADALAESDVATNAAIGRHGAQVLWGIWETLGRPPRLEIATHCNAGWLGCVDWGTALAGVYAAHDAGLPLHVWVDETRPVNQGSRLTAWELAAHGVPHTLQVDAASGYQQRSGRVHVCVVGADRVTARGDVCNKIGTYLLALAAHDNRVPFYAALPMSTFDGAITDAANIEIENRDAAEVTHVWGRADDGQRVRVQIAPDGTPAANPAFDVTPARLITGLITESGVFAPADLNAASQRAAS
jgi:methylthioribose-1-phosphate isomerase